MNNMREMEWESESNHLCVTDTIFSSHETVEEQNVYILQYYITTGDGGMSIEGKNSARVHLPN
jgi:hypothetical protein